MFFSIWHILLSIMPLWSIHVVAMTKLYYFSWILFHYILYIYIYIYISNFFISSFIDGHLDCFYTLAIVNNALMNMKMHFSKLLCSFSLYKCTKVELQENMVLLPLIFWGSSKLLSIASVPIYILTNSTWEFPLLYNLTNMYYFLSFLFNNCHHNRCEVRSYTKLIYDFNLHFPMN